MEFFCQIGFRNFAKKFPLTLKYFFISFGLQDDAEMDGLIEEQVKQVDQVLSRHIFILKDRI